MYGNNIWRIRKQQNDLASHLALKSANLQDRTCSMLVISLHLVKGGLIHLSWGSSSITWAWQQIKKFSSCRGSLHSSVIAYPTTPCMPSSLLISQVYVFQIIWFVVKRCEKLYSELRLSEVIIFFLVWRILYRLYHCVTSFCIYCFLHMQIW